METLGLGLYFEDLPVGRQFKTIGRTVTEADITNFVNCTGMVEVLFTNTEFLAHESDIKGRPARARWSTALPRGCSCNRRCSTPASPFCTWNCRSKARSSPATRSTPNARSSRRGIRRAGRAGGSSAPRARRQAGRHRRADLHALAHGEVPRRGVNVLKAASNTIVPAKAGTHSSASVTSEEWVPVFAGTR